MTGLAGEAFGQLVYHRFKLRAFAVIFDRLIDHQGRRIGIGPGCHQRRFHLLRQPLQRELNAVELIKEGHIGFHLSHVKVTGQAYGALRPVKVIFFMAFEFFEDSPQVHSVFEMLERRRHSRLHELLELHFLELPKLGRAQAQVDTREQPWLQYLRGPSPDELKELMMKEPMIARAAARQSGLSREHHARLESWLRLRDYIESTGVKEWGERMRLRAEAAEQALLLEQEASRARDLALVEKERVLAEQRQALAKKDEALVEQRQALAQQNQALITTTRQLLEQRFGVLPPELVEALQQPANVLRLPTLLPQLLATSELDAVLKILQDS